MSDHLNINEIKMENEQTKKTVSFSESITIKKNENNYEQSNYELLKQSNLFF